MHKIPLIITGHTEHADKHTIINSRNFYINVIENVDICKKNNPNIEFYTIYSVDESINSKEYFDYFDKVLYSENIRHSWTGEKIKVETALNFIKDMEWNYFVKTCSRCTLNSIEQFISIPGQYDYIGRYYQTSIQYDLSCFIGSKKLINTWIDCEPRMEKALTVTGFNDWRKYYGVSLLENLFYNSCKSNSMNILLPDNLYQVNWSK